MNLTTEHLRDLDRARFWHPFTQMKDWGSNGVDPIVLVKGEGAWLFDSEGNRYLDGNSSIWTNIHGHSHPKIDAAIRGQLDQLSHCSALGFSNEPAIRLTERLCSLMPGSGLERVFYTDNGSTAIECACKMAIQFRQLTGEPDRNQFVSFEHAYHGDTAGAASLGGIGSFHGRFAGTGFGSIRVSDLESLGGLSEQQIHKVTAVCIEPLIQGAAGMRIWPDGMLRRLRDWCTDHDVLLILDEVMTGFGRTGRMFACEHEGVVPDFLCLAKGLTGGYLPLAATLTNERVYSAFLGGYDETFFYGHSYCGNPLGCSAAMANLSIFEEENVLASLPEKVAHFRGCLDRYFAGMELVLDIRQLGLIAGIEIGPFDWRDFMGAKVAVAARSHGLLTRSIRDTLVLMPPLCSSNNQIESMVEGLAGGLEEVVSKLA